MLRDMKRKRTVFVHHLVAEAFIGPRPLPNFHAAHLNGNRSDNRLENIAWVSPHENEAHKLKHGTRARGERQHLSKLTDSKVKEMRELQKTGLTFKKLAETYGVTIAAAHRAVRGFTWKHVVGAKP